MNDHVILDDTDTIDENVKIKDDLVDPIVNWSCALDYDTYIEEWSLLAISDLTENQ